MKILSRIILLPTAAIMVTACQHAEVKKSTFVTNPEITKSFVSGSWHVAAFKVNGKQGRDKFLAYHFSFTGRNLVSVKKQNVTFMGNWWVESDAFTDDEPATDLAFAMDFQRHETLRYLNGKWIILQRTPNKLQLIGLSADEREYLTFEKDANAKVPTE